MENHKIDYFIQGEEMQLVEIELDNIEYDDTILQQKLANVKSKLEKDVDGSH